MQNLPLFQNEADTNSIWNSNRSYTPEDSPPSNKLLATSYSNYSLTSTTTANNSLNNISTGYNSSNTFGLPGYQYHQNQIYFNTNNDTFKYWPSLGGYPTYSSINSNTNINNFLYSTSSGLLNTNNASNLSIHSNNSINFPHNSISNPLCLNSTPSSTTSSIDVNNNHNHNHSNNHQNYINNNDGGGLQMMDFLDLPKRKFSSLTQRRKNLVDKYILEVLSKSHQHDYDEFGSTMWSSLLLEYFREDKDHQVGLDSIMHWCRDTSWGRRMKKAYEIGLHSIKTGGDPIKEYFAAKTEVFRKPSYLSPDGDNNYLCKQRGRRRKTPKLFTFNEPVHPSARAGLVNDHDYCRNQYMDTIGDLVVQLPTASLVPIELQQQVQQSQSHHHHECNSQQQQHTVAVDIVSIGGEIEIDAEMLS